jgi:hypothetical protein
MHAIRPSKSSTQQCIVAKVAIVAISFLYSVQQIAAARALIVYAI